MKRTLATLLAAVSLWSTTADPAYALHAYGKERKFTLAPVAEQAKQVAQAKPVAQASPAAEANPAQQPPATPQVKVEPQKTPQEIACSINCAVPIYDINATAVVAGMPTGVTHVKKRVESACGPYQQSQFSLPCLVSEGDYLQFTEMRGILPARLTQAQIKQGYTKRFSAPKNRELTNVVRDGKITYDEVRRFGKQMPDGSFVLEGDIDYVSYSPDGKPCSSTKIHYTVSDCPPPATPEPAPVPPAPKPEPLPRLTFTKKMKGGSASASQFRFTIDDYVLSQGQDMSMEPGTYTVREVSGPENFASEYKFTCAGDGVVSADPCMVKLENGKEYQVTGTNEYIPPKVEVPPPKETPTPVPPTTVTVEKKVVNNSGRSRKPSDFTPFMNGAKIDWSKAYEVKGDFVTISEKPTRDYVSRVAGADKDGKVKIVPNTNNIIVVTNDDVPKATLDVTGMIGRGRNDVSYVAPPLPSSCPAVTCTPEVLQNFTGPNYSVEAVGATRHTMLDLGFKHESGTTKVNTAFGALKDRFANRLSKDKAFADAYASFGSKIRAVGNAGGSYTRFKMNNGVQGHAREGHVGGGIGFGDFTDSYLAATVGIKNQDVPVLFPAVNLNSGFVANGTTPYASVRAQGLTFGNRIQAGVQATADKGFNASYAGSPMRVTNKFDANAYVQYNIRTNLLGGLTLSPRIGAAYEQHKFASPTFGSGYFRNPSASVGLSIGWGR